MSFIIKFSFFLIGLMIGNFLFGFGINRCKSNRVVNNFCKNIVFDLFDVLIEYKIDKDGKFVFNELNEGIEILTVAKKKGYKVYLLSNSGENIFNKLKRDFEIFDLFDGILCSFHVGTTKPDIRFYKSLLKKFNLKAEESLYIDDKQVNVNAAKDVGMKGLVFVRNSVKKRLQDLNVF